MKTENGRHLETQDRATVVVEASRPVDRASQIINPLRDFGRKSDMRKKRVDRNAAMHGVMAILDRQLKLQGTDVDTRLTQTCRPFRPIPTASNK